MIATVYTDMHRPIWDAAVHDARNGTFLFDRAYMDYHRDRFTDASLLFHHPDGTLAGLLPATLHAESKTVVSHGGLTYGGIICMPEASLVDVREMMRAAAAHYLATGLCNMIYKPVPAIYHSYPSDDECYWLFRAGARLTARGASTALRLDSPLSERLWHRKTKKHAAEGLVFSEQPSGRLPEFWCIVEEVLSTRHATQPVHTATEMQRLMEALPRHIRLFAATNEDDRIIAASVVYITERCLHVQYMETGAEGRRRRALDLLIRHLIDYARNAGITYFDFGISTEHDGTWLNEGLAYQKEGFGGRTVCYDCYEVALDRLAAL